MSVCRADIGRWLLAGCLLAGSAQAQTAPPPPANFDPDTMEMADPPSGDRAASVEVNTLKAPNAEAFGILDPAAGGFGPALWTGTQVRVVRALLPQLPPANGSLTVRALERRLLLSSATPPDGAVEGDKPSLVELRAERLMALGDLDGALSLASSAPASVSGIVLGKVKLDSLLLSGNISGACAEARRQASAGNTDTTLAKTVTLCHFIGGNALQGNMGLDLLHERKDPDVAFIAAAEVVSGLPPMAPGKVKLDEATPLHVAAYAAAKMPIPVDVAAKAPAAVARSLTLSAANSPEVRLASAERAEAVGALPTDALRQLYLEMVFAPTEMGAPLTQADSLGQRGRALLFRTASDQPDPILRGQFVAKALQLAEAKGQLPAAARVFTALLADLKPDVSINGLAVTIARAHISLGEMDKAKQWIDIAKAEPTNAKAVDALWPYLAVTANDPGQAMSAAAYGVWRDGLTGLPNDVAARRTALILGTLAGLGAKVPETAWLDTLGLPNGGPKPGLFAMMQGAALDSRLGSTVLTALVTLGGQPVDRVDPLSLSESISALCVVGLTADARKLAVEYLMANGL